MASYLDHFTVPCRNRVVSAKLLAGLLGVPWAETGVGPFSPVYLNDGLTLDCWSPPSARTSLVFPVRLTELLVSVGEAVGETLGKKWN